jgi:hypothetical protein
VVTATTERSLVIRKGVSFAVAGLGIATAVTLPGLAWWWITIHPGVNAPPPSCPSGTNLYARSLAGGKMQSTIYHCFRDEDEQEDTLFAPSGRSP